MTRVPERHAEMRCWLHEPLSADVHAALLRLQGTEDVRRIAVMPDVHLAHDVCVGTVVATSQLIFPMAVGGDIGCGMAAIAFDCEADLLAAESAAGRLLAGLYQTVPVMRHAKGRMPDRLPDALQQIPLSDSQLEKLMLRDGRVQFGTLGRGNHFLEFQADEEGRLWLMVHSGSRAMGQAITDHHLRQTRPTATGLHHLVADSPEGHAYLADLSWAVDYAQRSRRRMVEAVAELMGGLFKVEIVESSLIHCDHNHVRREIHFGEQLWVHRKGATSAQAGEPGIIPGSMGTASFCVEGRGHTEGLCSSSHGAGRAMTRTEARRRISPRELQRQVEGVWFDHRAALPLCEEAPSAYKDVHAVMRAQRELTRIVRRLRPVLSYKGT